MHTFEFGQLVLLYIYSNINRIKLHTIYMLARFKLNIYIILSIDWWSINSFILKLDTIYVFFNK